jgi:hypothetical protein
MDNPKAVAGQIAKAVPRVTLHLFSRRHLVTNLGRPERIAPSCDQRMLFAVDADTLSNLVHPALPPSDGDHLGMLEEIDHVFVFPQPAALPCLAG